ncbi:collagen triple helix repeat protein [Streptomyces noursei ATCC 11455]|nr:collagen triple helix repeat protein [Streptomyces noursei ATCC 11455]
MTKPEKTRAPRTSTLVTVALWALVLLSAGFAGLALRIAEDSNHRYQSEQDAQSTVISKLSEGLDTTREQLQRHGVKPSAPPAQTIVRGVPGAPGATGAAGPQGPAGSVGPSRPPGPTGPAGQTGAAGKAGASGSNGSPGAAGPTGAPGASGTNGSAGPAGPAGPKGDTGPSGATGPAGADGKNGKPSASWTYTDALGQHYTCSPAPGFDPNNPRYVCTADQSAPLPVAPSKQGLLGVAGLASTAAYRRRLRTP